MAELAALLTDAYTALEAIGPPVRMDGDPDPGSDEVIVLALVSNTSRQHYGGRATDTRLQVTSYAPTTLRTAALDSQCTAALEGIGLHHLQTRTAPDPDSIGLLSEFTS